MSQARKGTTRRRRMRCDERLVVVRRGSPRQWGSKTMARAESGKPKADGSPSERVSFNKAATGQCREDKRDKESHRSFPGEAVEVEEGELLVRRKCRSLVGGEEERWREELRGWSVRRKRHHGFSEGRRQRRERGERGERNQRNPLGNQRDGTEGSREGEEAAWAGRDAALRTHSNWMMLVFDRVQLLLVLLGLLVVLAARHTAEGECARSEVRVVERNGGHDAGAVRVQWVQRDGLGARVSGRRRAGGALSGFRRWRVGSRLVQVAVDGLAGCTRLGI